MVNRTIILKLYIYKVTTTKTFQNVIYYLFQMVTNYKNTVHGFKKFHGRAFDDPYVQSEKAKLPYSLHKLANGNAGIKVKHCANLQHVLFTAFRLFPFLTDLKPPHFLLSMYTFVLLNSLRTQNRIT